MNRSRDTVVACFEGGGVAGWEEQTNKRGRAPGETNKRSHQQLPLPLCLCSLLPRREGREREKKRVSESTNERSNTVLFERNRNNNHRATVVRSRVGEWRRRRDSRNREREREGRLRRFGSVGPPAVGIRDRVWSQLRLRSGRGCEYFIPVVVFLLLSSLLLSVRRANTVLPSRAASCFVLLRSPASSSSSSVSFLFLSSSLSSSRPLFVRSGPEQPARFVIRRRGVPPPPPSPLHLLFSSSVVAVRFSSSCFSRLVADRQIRGRWGRQRPPLFPGQFETSEFEYGRPGSETMGTSTDHTGCEQMVQQPADMRSGNRCLLPWPGETAPWASLFLLPASPSV